MRARLCGFDAKASLGEQQQRARALACALGKQRILRVCTLELNDAMGIHSRADILHDFGGHPSGLGSEMHYVLYAAGTCDGPRGHLGSDAYEHVAWEERLKARPCAHEREEREIMLAPEIELDPPLRARLCVNELPGSIAERRHVGVVHGSDFIHN
jgi:hypothetical protein